MTRFARFAWALLAYDVAVAAWGAYVRATGSGAGCGRHWPLCNGTVVPHAPRIETIVELSHRVSSGVALAATVVLFAWAMLAYPAGHRVRRGAGAAAAFMAAEALIGAGLVLFALVARDASAKRALTVSLHFINTFLLLASTALTAWWASGGAALRIRGRGAALGSALAPLVAMIFVGTSGALTALGDTLFPASSLASGLAQDFASGGSGLVRLRILHPAIAVATSLLVVVSAGLTSARSPTRAALLTSRASVVLVVAQVTAGLVDVATLAPVWMQLLHLVLADAVWVSLVLSAAATLAATSDTASAAGDLVVRPLPRSEPAPPALRARQDGTEGGG